MLSKESRGCLLNMRIPELCPDLYAGSEAALAPDLMTFQTVLMMPESEPFLKASDSKYGLWVNGI